MKRIFVVGLCSAAIMTSITILAGYVYTTDPYAAKTNAHWFLGLGGAIDSIFSTKDDSFLDTVQTFPGYPAGPSDLFGAADTNNVSGMVSIFAGRQWAISNGRLVQLFFEYDDVGRTTANGQRLAFNTNGYGNLSNYSYDISRRAFLLGAKLDLQNLGNHVMPYLEGGLGLSQNRFSSFTNITDFNEMYPFPNNETNQFACELGAGLDWYATKNWLFSAGYRFGYWGDLKSGHVSNGFPPAGALPAPIQLSQTLYSNQASIKMSYLF